MSPPIQHAESSARRYGGLPEDYLDIHHFLDSSKSFLPDLRHRILLHHTLGIAYTELAFGKFISNSIGKKVMVRLIAEDHIIDDLGAIPTPNFYFRYLQKWLLNTIERPTIDNALADYLETSPISTSTQLKLAKFLYLPFLYTSSSYVALYYSNFGIHLAEQIFGIWIDTSRYRTTENVLLNINSYSGLELVFVDDILRCCPILPWFSGFDKKTKKKLEYYLIERYEES